MVHCGGYSQQDLVVAEFHCFYARVIHFAHVSLVSLRCCFAQCCFSCSCFAISCSAHGCFAHGCFAHGCFAHCCFAHGCFAHGCFAHGFFAQFFQSYRTYPVSSVKACFTVSSKYLHSTLVHHHGTPPS